MQQNYQYELVEQEGKNFADGFNPHFTPKEMLSMGVFEGKYLNSCTEEYPSNWFETAILSDKPNPSINYFAIKSRQPLNRETYGAARVNVKPCSNGLMTRLFKATHELKS